MALGWRPSADYHLLFCATNEPNEGTSVLAQPRDNSPRTSNMSTAELCAKLFAFDEFAANRPGLSGSE